jgi:hypothetical protein
MFATDWLMSWKVGYMYFKYLMTVHWFEQLPITLNMFVHYSYLLI